MRPLFFRVFRAPAPPFRAIHLQGERRRGRGRRLADSVWVTLRRVAEVVQRWLQPRPQPMEPFIRLSLTESKLQSVDGLQWIGLGVPQNA